MVGGPMAGEWAEVPSSGGPLHQYYRARWYSPSWKVVLTLMIHDDLWSDGLPRLPNGTVLPGGVVGEIHSYCLLEDAPC